MPFKSEKQRKWMWANDPEMAKDWENKKESLTKESGILYKAGVKKYGKEGMKKIQQAAGKRKSHAEIGKIKDKYEKDKKEEGFGGDLKGSDKKKFEKERKENAEQLGYKVTGVSDIREKAERDYKDEYKKFQSSTKAKKYRAELNKYNRKKGTYGNGDGKDASHKGGKIVGFESQSKNRGRAEKSRLKKESYLTKLIDEAIDEYQVNEGTNQMTQIYKDLDKKFKNYDSDKIADFNKVDKYLKTKFSKGSGLPDAIASFYHDYRSGEDMKKNINRLTKYAKKMKGYAKEGVNEAVYKFKGMTATNMDELDADLSRENVKGTPDFNKMTYTIHRPKKDVYLDYYIKTKYKKFKPKMIKESVNEAFRPSDKKALMVIGRDTINKLRKTSPDIDRPDKQLGQAINAIFRAMTREKSDANYKQYKKYFPKYNDKLLRRLAKAYFDQPFNVQNTFMRQVMDYTFKESVKEYSGFSGMSKWQRDRLDQRSKEKGKKPKKVSKALKKKQDAWSKKYTVKGGGINIAKWKKDGSPGFPKESVNEGQKKFASKIVNKFDQAYLKFSREVRDVIKMMDRSTGDKTDGKIIDKAYSKGLIPLDKLMKSWNSGQQKNPNIDESVNEKVTYHDGGRTVGIDVRDIYDYMVSIKKTNPAKFKKDMKNKALKGIWDRYSKGGKMYKEADLGLTYKKGKTVKVKHKTSGKSLIIIDKPNVRKEYEKIGFFAEGSCGYGIDGKVGKEPAGPHLIKKNKKKVNEDVQDLKKVVKELENASKMHLAQSKRIQSHLDDMNVDEKVIKVSKKDDVPGNPMKMSGEEKIKKLVYSGSINNKGSYEIKGKNLNVIGIRPRDKGFFVRHFTMKTGFRKANLYYDGVSWMNKNKKF